MIGTVFFMVAFFMAYFITYIYPKRMGMVSVKDRLCYRPSTTANSIRSPPAGRLAERIGNGPILTIGGLLGATGLTLHLIFTNSEPDYVMGIFIPGILIGFAAGFGFAQLIEPQCVMCQEINLVWQGQVERQSFN